MLFEVVYGAGEGLHSKFPEVMISLLSYYKSNSESKTLQALVRCLFLKLINEVDIEKQQPLFDIIDKQLNINECNEH